MAKSFSRFSLEGFRKFALEVSSEISGGPEIPVLGPDIPGLTPELPVPRKFPEQTSGAKFRTPTREKNAKDLAKKTQMKIWAGISSASAGTSGGRNFRPPGRNFRPTEKQQKLQYENGHIFCIRTPFSMILGSLES